jgi:hypothetical protein
MSRASRFVTSRITLAVIGVVLVGGAGGVWAATGGPHLPGQAATASGSPSSSTVTNPGDATATPNDGVSPTATTVARPAPTQAPRPTATSCPGAPGPNLHVQGVVVHVNSDSFQLSTGCFSPLTIQVNGSTAWPGTAKSLGGPSSPLLSGWQAEVVATQVASNTYLASIVDAQPDN